MRNCAYFSHLLVSFSSDFAPLPKIYLFIILKNNTKCSYYLNEKNRVNNSRTYIHEAREAPDWQREATSRPKRTLRWTPAIGCPAVLGPCSAWPIGIEQSHTWHEQALGHRLLLLHESPAQADIRRRIRRIALRQFASIDFAVIQCRVYHIIFT